MERVAAQMALADLPLTAFLNEAIVPYESDAVTRLIFDTHDAGRRLLRWQSLYRWRAAGLAAVLRRDW